MNNRKEQLQALDRLLTIMDELREQCPWDKKQTMQSLRHLTIEETYELGDAILDNDLNEVKMELGDVLLHIIFYSKIGSENNDFDIADVANAICDKLVNRHPHIYGDVKVLNEDDVKRNWEQIKLKEGKKSVLEGVPRSSRRASGRLSKGFPKGFCKVLQRLPEGLLEGFPRGS